MANASAYGGSSAYSEISLGDFYRPELFEKVIQTYGQEGMNSFFNVFSGAGLGTMAGQGLFLGQAKPVKTVDYWHYDRLRMMPQVKLDANAGSAGGAAGEVTSDKIVLHADSHSADGKKSPIRNGDIYILSVDGNQYRVSDLDTTTDGSHEFNLTPIKSTVTAPNVTANAIMVYIGNAYEEGSDPTSSWISEDHKVVGKLQIVKEQFKATNTATSVWTPIQWQGGFGIPEGNYRVHQDERDAIARFFLAMDRTLLFQEPFDNTSNITEITRTTTGLKPLITNTTYGGFSTTYSTPAMSDVIAINKTLNKIKAPKEYKWIVGYDLGNALEEMFTNYFNVNSSTSAAGAIGAAAINYASYNGSKEIALSMGVKSFTRGGFTHHLQIYSEFSDENSFYSYDAIKGTSGAFGYSGFIIPMEKVRDYSSDLTGNVGQNQNYMVYPMLIRYLEGNGQNRFFRTVKFGTSSGQALGTQKDINGYDYTGEFGLQVRGIKHFGYITKS